MYMCVWCVYVNVSVQGERDRDREKQRMLHKNECVCCGGAEVDVSLNLKS